MQNGARATYHFSGVVPFGQNAGITLFGSEGVLRYDLMEDRIFGANRVQGSAKAGRDWPEIPIPKEKEGGWNVEADFIAAIRTGRPVEFTSFATGVAYMEFTEAVARSARDEAPVDLPLAEFEEE